MNLLIARHRVRTQKSFQMHCSCVTDKADPVRSLDPGRRKLPTARSGEVWRSLLSCQQTCSIKSCLITPCLNAIDLLHSWWSYGASRRAQLPRQAQGLRRKTFELVSLGFTELLARRITWWFLAFNMKRTQRSGQGSPPRPADV